MFLQWGIILKKEEKHLSKQENINRKSHNSQNRKSITILDDPQADLLLRLELRPWIFFKGVSVRGRRKKFASCCSCVECVNWHLYISALVFSVKTN